MYTCCICRDVVTCDEGGGGEKLWAIAPTSISEIQQSQFQHQAYCFLCVFRNYMDQKFHNFYRFSYHFWAIYGGFPVFLTT